MISPIKKSKAIIFLFLFAFFALTLSSTLMEGKEKKKGETKNKLKVYSVTENIHMLNGKGGNIGICTGGDGVFMIDDKFAPLTRDILAHIKALGKTRVNFLVNTHWHGDHTGGNENFGKRGAVIIAHKNVRKTMSVDQVMKIFKRKVKASPKEALPVITFTRDVTFHFNGETIRVRHYPNAHTNGDAFVHFEKANVIHTGDLFFNGFFPFIDVEHGGSLDGMIGAAEKILKISNEKTKIIPGHGPLASRKDLIAFRDMLKSVRKLVKRALEKNQTISDVASSKAFQKIDKKWGQGFMKGKLFLKIAFASLQK